MPNGCPLMMNKYTSLTGELLKLLFDVLLYGLQKLPKTEDDDFENRYFQDS